MWFFVRTRLFRPTTILRSFSTSLYEILWPKKRLDFLPQFRLYPCLSGFNGRDVAGQAQTRQDKWLFNGYFSPSFNSPRSHLEYPHPRVLILAPHSELVQISNDAEFLAKACGLKTALAYGGDGYDKQHKRLSVASIFDWYDGASYWLCKTRRNWFRWNSSCRARWSGSNVRSWIYPWYSLFIA